MYILCIFSKIEHTINQTGVEDQSASSIPDDVFKQVISLLKLVMGSVARYPEAAALFMDELAGVIHKGIIDPKVEVGCS